MLCWWYDDCLNNDRSVKAMLPGYSTSYNNRPYSLEVGALRYGPSGEIFFDALSCGQS